MLDYEILNYKIQYIPKDDIVSYDHITDTEESAISFIKENRHKWKHYRLLKCQMAIIDF